MTRVFDEEKIEDILGSKGKIRILITLAKDPEAWHTLYSLEQRTGIRRTYLRKDIESLVERNVVSKSEFLPLKYRLNLQYPLSRQISDFLVGLMAGGTPSP